MKEEQDTGQRIFPDSEKVAYQERSLIKIQENQSRLIVDPKKSMKKFDNLTFNDTVIQYKSNQFVPRVPLHMDQG